MSINLFGPKEIYNYKEFSEVNAFCTEDSPHSVETFKQFYQAGGAGAFLNGYDVSRNILMWAARCANVSLVGYIVEHADPKILDMRDNLGFSALHYAVKSSGPTEKVLACTQILLEAGANKDARWLYEKALTPSAYSALNEYSFVGENALGLLVRQLSNPLPAREREKYEMLTQLLLSYGATKGYDQGSDESGNDVGWFSIEDGLDKKDTSKRAKNGRILQAVAAKWLKTRLLFLGNKDSNSHLSQLPGDLVKLIFKKISL